MITNRTPHRLVVLLVIMAACVAGGISFLLPVVPTVENPSASHWRMAMSMIFVTLFFGAAIWFLGGLRSFKTPLRVSYTWLGVGLISVALATLQLPIIGLLDLWDSAWATGGGVITVFMVGAICMYFGALKLAETLREDGFAMSPVAVTAAIIGVTIASFFVAGPLVQYEAEGINVYIATIVWCTCYVGLAGLLSLRTARDVGQAYQPSLRALAAAFFVFSMSGAAEIIGTLIVGNDHPYQAYGISLWPFIITGLVFLWASYEFNLLTARTTVAEVAVEQDIITITDRDYIDSIVAVTALASRPEAIRPVVDELETIANDSAATSRLTDVQKQKLVDVYYQLEGYLIEDDPLRTYSKEDVREQVSAGFNAVLSRTSGAHHASG